MRKSSGRNLPRCPKELASLASGYGSVSCRHALVALSTSSPKYACSRRWGRSGSVVGCLQNNTPACQCEDAVRQSKRLFDQLLDQQDRRAALSKLPSNRENTIYQVQAKALPMVRPASVGAAGAPAPERPPASVADHPTDPRRDHSAWQLFQERTPAPLRPDPAFRAGKIVASQRQVVGDRELGEHAMAF